MTLKLFSLEKGGNKIWPLTFAGAENRSMGECFERFKMGALMGGSVGACIGILFGSYAVMRYSMFVFMHHLLW